ncbi:MAG: hypothetical protein ACMUEM_01610 [Flavobacteriales bacterium AspAUS03]
MTWNAHHKISLAFFYAANSGSPYSSIYNNASPNAFNNKSKALPVHIHQDKGDVNLRNVIRDSQVVYSADEQ